MSPIKRCEIIQQPCKGDIIIHPAMSQSLTKLYVHLVFSTKNRADLIPRDKMADVYSYIAGLLENVQCPAIRVGGTANHVHILFVQSKTMSISDIVRLVKSNSSKWISAWPGHRVPFSWQDGYGAFSISQSHVDDVSHYIQNQEEHHAHLSFQDELRRICDKYGVNLDDKYAWE